METSLGTLIQKDFSLPSWMSVFFSFKFSFNSSEESIQQLNCDTMTVMSTLAFLIACF